MEILENVMTTIGFGSRFLGVGLALALAGCGGAGEGDTSAAAQDSGDQQDAGADGATVFQDKGPDEDGDDIFDSYSPPDVTVPDSVNYVIVYDDSLDQAAGQIAEYRESTGFRTAKHSVSDVLPDIVTVYDLVGVINSLLAIVKDGLDDDAPVYLLLLGDVPSGPYELNGHIPAVPCNNIIGGCLTDNDYGDLDGDNVPDVAVGRIPASTNEQALEYLDKLKRHESEYKVGLWNRRVSVYTGEANFGMEIDAMLEMAVMKGLTKVSHAFDIIGAYDNSGSSYYYMPFEEKVIDLFNQDNVMVVYIGHGSTEWTQGLDSDQVPKVHCKNRLPATLFFACHAGNYAGNDDCLAEELLWKDDGPIVTYGSSDVSHPYGNAVLVYESQRAVLNSRAPTFGLALLESKVQSIVNQDEFRDFIDAAAQLEVPEYQLVIIRDQHLDLYNLLGDPAAAVRYPGSDAVFDDVEGGMSADQIRVQGTAPGVGDGTAWVTLEMERDVILWPLDPVDPDDPDQQTVQSNWEKAVDKVLSSAEVDVVSGAFEADLDVPDGLPTGAYWIKVYAYDDVSDSFGAVQAP